MVLVHRKLAAWLKKDNSRKAMLLNPTDKTCLLRLYGPGNSGNFNITTFAEISYSESGISGGGSAPDGIERAILDWEAQAKNL